MVMAIVVIAIGNGIAAVKIDHHKYLIDIFAEDEISFVGLGRAGDGCFKQDTLAIVVEAGSDIRYGIILFDTSAEGIVGEFGNIGIACIITAICVVVFINSGKMVVIIVDIGIAVFILSEVTGIFLR